MEILIQLLLVTAAATVLGDVDLAGRRTDVDEVAEVTDTLRGVGVGCTVGQGEAVVAGTAEDRGMRRCRTRSRLHCSVEKMLPVT